MDEYAIMIAVFCLNQDFNKLSQLGGISISRFFIASLCQPITPCIQELQKFIPTYNTMIIH